MQGLNRSQPHILIIQHGLEILRNLSKCWRTAPNVYSHPLCSHVLVHIMQGYRDFPVIFRAVVSLLYNGVRSCPNFASKINSTPEQVQRIKQIYQLVKRKLATTRKFAETSRTKNAKQKYAVLKKCAAATKILVEALENDKRMEFAATKK
mmetsp:Transcript_35491/g.60111  ORF Transcript_35491/g.60111 Transcript_35491/m.60111 type:complete len:150 (+) Transcript_35491:109-558(+)